MTEGLAWVLPALTFLAGMGDGADPTAKAPTPETFQAAPRKMQIFSLFPSGAERGTSVEVEVLGANLDGLRRVESSCPGVSMDVISSSYLAARVRFRIARDASASDASDASSGQCRIRMFSALGASNLQVFRIGELPEAVEREPNDSPETAQHLHLPCVVDGRLYPDEDVDFYLIEGKAGEQVTARVRAGSNGSGLNPEIYLLNEAGLRLAVGVNEEGSDPVLRYRFEAQGNYRLAVRGTFGALNISFPTGHPAYVYQLWVADSVPEIRYAQPFTVDADATSAVHVTGQDLSSVDSLMFSDPGMKATIVERAPDQLVAQIHAGGPGVRQMWAMAGPVRSSAVNLLVTAKPDRSGTAPHHTPEQALELNLAEAATGRIARAGDADYYAFKAPEAGLYVWELQAGKFASMLDPKVELLDETGKVLQSGDGAPDSDVKLERKLKGDEKICVKVSQSVLNYAGPGYNYRLLARTAQPTFTLTAGALSISAPTAGVSLGSQVASTTSSTISGSLGVVTVTDQRGGTTTWTASAISTAFTPTVGPADPASNVSYGAGTVTVSATVVATAVAAADLNGVSTVVTGASTGISTASWNPTISVMVPGNYAPGVYSATITHSVA